jgi:hypothetical protein
MKADASSNMDLLEIRANTMYLPEDKSSGEHFLPDTFQFIIH